jgi:hypothetical protein
MKKLAICISGSLRSFDYCKKSFISHIIEPNKNFFEIEIFLFTPDDDFSHKINLFEELTSFYVIKKDEIIEHSNKIKSVIPIEKKDRVSKGGIQGYLQQLKGINESFKLAEKYEKENCVSFDFVLRCRPDVIYKEKIDLSSFNPEVITVPKFHSTKGINDRFAFGNRENMKHYMNMYPNILKKDNIFKHAEVYCKMNLDNNKVTFLQKNILFNRVREGNKISSDSF